MVSSHGSSSALRLWLKVLVFWLVFMAVIFLPAGSLDWPAAWIFFGLYFCWAVPVVHWLSKHNPELLRERMKGPIQKDQKGWDKVFVLVTLVVFLAFVVILGFDAVRYGWAPPPLPLQVAAFVAMLPVLWVLFLVLRENTFLSKSVRIQEGHRVISTGPYGVVRHPMYTAVIVFQLALPVALGSLWALVPGVMLVALFIVRTVLEDRTLHEELPGYPEYAERVRYRLVPGVW